MARSFGAICEGCGERFFVTDGPIKAGPQVRCDTCGAGSYERPRELRLAEHLVTRMPADHFAARGAATNELCEIERRLHEDWRRHLPFGASSSRALRRRKAELQARLEVLQWAEAAALAASPLPPVDTRCPCGGERRRGAPIRCPACRSTSWHRDRAVPESMAD